jgi:hypothetical protein
MDTIVRSYKIKPRKIPKTKEVKMDQRANFTPNLSFALAEIQENMEKLIARLEALSVVISYNTPELDKVVPKKSE